MTKQLKVDSVVNVAGTGKPNFPVSPTSGGAALSTLNTHSYTSSATEPSSPKNGAIWWDSANSKVYVYANGEFKEVTLNTAYPSAYSPSNPWNGDRTLSTDENSLQIDYFDMTTTTNAADFGDLTQVWSGVNASFSDASRGVMHNDNKANPVTTTNLEYVTIATLGNASNFGNGRYGTINTAGASDGTYGIISCGFKYGSPNVTINDIYYVTIQTLGNAANFGDQTAALSSRGGISNATYGVFGGGYNYDGSTVTYSNVIDYITIDTTGNATDFGDISVARRDLSGCEDATRGVFVGGSTGSSGASNFHNTMEYITVATPGNATDFGDLSAGRGNLGAAGNGTRGVIVGGIEYPWASIVNTVEYITIQTTGNAADLLDLSQAASRPACFSGAAS
mgnify:CR=1 FL=1